MVEGNIRAATRCVSESDPLWGATNADMNFIIGSGGIGLYPGQGIEICIGNSTVLNFTIGYEHNVERGTFNSLRSFARCIEGACQRNHVSCSAFIKEDALNIVSNELLVFVNRGIDVLEALGLSPYYAGFDI